MKKIILLLIVLMPSFLFARTVDDIIKKLDKNRLFTTQKYVAEMTIVKGSRKLVKNMTGYAKANGSKSFTEFTNREDLGVKYLKIDNELWIYFPDADDVMKISGHMLKQGMMGSDISYEDMLESEAIEKKYEAKLLGDEKIDGHDCYVVELSAKVKDASYERQVVYIDKKRFAALKIEMYAKGGRLLKQMTLENIINQGNRYIPNKIIIQDMRKRNSKTIIEFKEILFDVKISDRIFEKRNLKR